MPVLGHAFVGAATAMSIKPSRPSPLGAALWLPIMIALAYLPDIASQAGALLGLAEPRVATHSVLFAMAACVVLAFPISILTRVSAWRVGLIALLSILLHDFCDLLQNTDR